MRPTRSTAFALSLIIFLCVGCAAPPPPRPIPYLAAEKPKGVIRTTEGGIVKKEFSRSGFYIGNYNFRPAPDVGLYVKEAAQAANTDILRNADVQLVVPFYFDLFFCGYGTGTDSVAGGK